MNELLDDELTAGEADEVLQDAAPGLQATGTDGPVAPSSAKRPSRNQRKRRRRRQGRR